MSTSYDPDKQTEALEEITRLTAEYEKLEGALNAKRDQLHEAIVRHQRERNAPPGRIADVSPYDRNHVGRLARAAGVEPLRKPPARRARKKPGTGTSK
ncbi:hypothetical protein [Streptomyces sp. ST2-7A]|uniref:hypothetical protein n=1 Tax=Streptomyces sp. ST2-7A TaxID=2907214 RepID=UPI001F33B4BC|nr:hypothetical protein [Streptomyces sp. ST2-7A]MCE7081200.1 hypothetical protein [Streptomyces sp. ST2-7A]